MTTPTPDRSGPDGHKSGWLEIVRHKVAGLRFGSVQITVHDGRVTQVESIRKIRFVDPPGKDGGKK